MFKVHFVGHLQCKLPLSLAFCNDKTRIPHTFVLLFFCFKYLIYTGIPPPFICYALLFYFLFQLNEISGVYSVIIIMN